MGGVPAKKKEREEEPREGFPGGGEHLLVGRQGGGEEKVGEGRGMRGREGDGPRRTEAGRIPRGGNPRRFTFASPPILPGLLIRERGRGCLAVEDLPGILADTWDDGLVPSTWVVKGRIHGGKRRSVPFKHKAYGWSSRAVGLRGTVVIHPPSFQPVPTVPAPSQGGPKTTVDVWMGSLRPHTRVPVCSWALTTPTTPCLVPWAVHCLPSNTVHGRTGSPTLGTRMVCIRHRSIASEAVERPPWRLSFLLHVCHHRLRPEGLVSMVVGMHQPLSLSLSFSFSPPPRVPVSHPIRTSWGRPGPPRGGGIRGKPKGTPHQTRVGVPQCRTRQGHREWRKGQILDRVAPFHPCIQTWKGKETGKKKPKDTGWKSPDWW